jgi:Rrf2 family protein
MHSIESVRPAALSTISIDKAYTPPMVGQEAGVCETEPVRITAKADYAVRAAAELAAAEAGVPVKGEQLAHAQGIPLNFLENILTELRRAGIVRTRRGADGGYQLARPPKEVTIADVLRAVEGPLAAVQGIQPQDLSYHGAAEHLPEVWVALRANLRAVLEKVTLADLASGRLPRAVTAKTADDDAWSRR